MMTFYTNILCVQGKNRLPELMAVAGRPQNNTVYSLVSS